MNANLTLSEIFTIVVVILIVFGPQRLPEMARKAGELVAKVRDAAASLRSELTTEFSDVAEPLQDIERDLRAAKDDIKASLPKLDAVSPLAPPTSDTPVRPVPASDETAAASDAQGDTDLDSGRIDGEDGREATAS